MVVAQQRAVAEARVPADILPIYAGNKRLHLHHGFAIDRFRNSVLDVPVAMPPVSQTFDLDGELAALVVLTTLNDAAFEVRLAGQSVHMSATQRNGTFAKPLLKVFSCSRALGKPWLYATGDSVEIRQSSACEPTYAEVGCRQKLKNPMQDPQSKVVGILTEA
ncbi:hypothetical protein RNZ50_23065 [Paracoccaceae bacterium Fryx2]|nr:hypothetical protein [Paracoccaceae bacterium Fryx2]